MGPQIKKKKKDLDMRDKYKKIDKKRWIHSKMNIILKNKIKQNLDSW